MNYRLLLGEMLIDYARKRHRETDEGKKQAYGEIVDDVNTCLDLEVGMIAAGETAKKILKQESHE